MQRITITLDDQLTDDFAKFREERGYKQTARRLSAI